ncbi:MAG: polysaccharide export protein [Gammaproteobacteria bacterium]|nr:polysaccharide export protein [Gammaproteobacteria bacterium]
MNMNTLIRLLTLGVAIFFAAATLAEELGYRLGSGDRVKVTVYGHEDLSGEFDLDSQGNISLPLIQEVRASGLTADQLEESITEALQPDYLKKPKVSVEVLTYRPFYIIGEVKAPGSYPYVSGMTVLNAVALAGGYTYRAKTKAVLITRPDGEEKTEIKANPDTTVLPGDVIEVPERFF